MYYACRMPPRCASAKALVIPISRSNLGITFNDLHEYVAGLKRAIKTPSEEYAKIGLRKDAQVHLQINSNILAD